MEEQMRILKMVEEGTITAEQAADLMSAMGLKEEDPGRKLQQAESGLIRTGYDRRMLRIKVDSVEGDKVNIQFPVGAVKKILKVTGKLPIPAEELEGFDMEGMMDAVIECMDSQITGDIVNVEDAAGTIVKIYID